MILRFEQIDNAKMPLWYGLFKNTNGRITREPTRGRYETTVYYGFDSHEEMVNFERDFRSRVKPIIETFKPKRSKWLRLLGVGR